MRRRDFIARSLRYYWRTNLAVILGVGVAVSALAGALVVGESVRASLRDLALRRLGRADHIVTATMPFTAQLAERLASSKDFVAARQGPAPVLALDGIVLHERSSSRAGGVQVYGVDDRFWNFHGVRGVAGPGGRDAFLSEALARELGAAEGDALLVRVQKPTAIPAGVIQGRRDDPGRAIRLSAARVLTSDQLGDFSPRPQQGAPRAIFLPLDRLQRDLELLHRVNMLVVGDRAAAAGHDLVALVERTADFADLGIRTRPVAGPAFAVESDAGLLVDDLARAASDAAREIGVAPVPVFTYIATAIKANGRETPYSLVSALPQDVVTGRLKPAPTSTNNATPIGAQSETVGAGFSRPGAKPIWLSQWTADDLAARPGDRVTLDYYVWSDVDGLSSASADFILAGVLPMEGIAVDRDLTPDYPGVSTSANITDWDPPFPVDLKRIRPKDEDYWDQYLAAPKAFIRIEDGQAMWRSRYGAHTSVRIPAAGRQPAELHALVHDVLPRHVSPSIAGFTFIPVRANALASATGTTDFGEYFTYFSFFLVVSSLLLTLLFFRLGIEQRAQEIGLLAAVGYTPTAVRNLLLAEGAVLASIGASIGIAGAIGYAALIMLALRTLWVDAVGTTDLVLHASASALAAGAAGGVVAGLACTAWSLRVLQRASARQLLAGSWSQPDSGVRAPALVARTAVVASALAVILIGASAAGLVPPAAAFFGSGTLLLVAGLCAMTAWLRGTSRRSVVAGAWPLVHLGLRNARYRPSRSVLSAALIAAATFLIVSVGAFRRGAEDVGDAKSASGGYALIAEAVAPIMHDPSTPGGREALSLGDDLADLRVSRFRLRPGDDASCLNLYRPQSPRLLGASDAFVAATRFSFARSIADIDAERANPWLLLNRRFDDGAVPVIGDATSLAYVFHLGVGDDFVMQGPDGGPLRLRIVGALRDSVLQSELIMSDAQFTRLFPRNEGFRLFLIETTRGAEVGALLEDRLQDFGLDAQSTSERLASYHRVENTFLTTFQALGGLGLVLGTFGLGTVLLRNVLERKRELALLRATGYTRAHLVALVMAESAFLLACGLALGAACAAVAIAPAYLERAQAFPVASTLGLLAAVFAAGMLSTIVATRVVARMPLLAALKNE